MLESITIGTDFKVVGVRVTDPWEWESQGDPVVELRLVIKGDRTLELDQLRELFEADGTVKLNGLDGLHFEIPPGLSLPDSVRLPDGEPWRIIGMELRSTFPSGGEAELTFRRRGKLAASTRRMKAPRVDRTVEQRLVDLLEHARTAKPIGVDAGGRVLYALNFGMRLSETQVEQIRESLKPLQDRYGFDCLILDADVTIGEIDLDGKTLKEFVEQTVSRAIAQNNAQNKDWGRP